MSADKPTSGNPNDEHNNAGATSKRAGAHAIGVAGNIGTQITARGVLSVEASVPEPQESPEIQIPGPQEIPIPPVFTDWATPFQTRSAGAFGAGGFNSAAFNTTPYNEMPFQFGEATTIDSSVTAEAVKAISRTILRNPELVRNTSRGLAAEFAREVEDRRRTKPNGEEALEQYERLIVFLDATARGFTELADALDKGMAQGGTVVEPILLGRAAVVAQQLQSACSDWLADNHGMIIEGAIKIGLFGLGMMFLGLLGSQSNLAAIGAIGTIVTTLSKRKER